MTKAIERILKEPSLLSHKFKDVGVPKLLLQTIDNIMTRFPSQIYSSAPVTEQLLAFISTQINAFGINRNFFCLYLRGKYETKLGNACKRVCAFTLVETF